MSVKLYTHRCKPEDLWVIHDILRRWALVHSDGAKRMLRALAKDHLDREAQAEGDPFESRAMKFYDKWNETSADKGRDNEDVRFQVFYEPSGTLLLRFLINMHPTRVVEQVLKDTGERLPVKNVYAQNSCDMSATDRRNMPIADWLDEQITEHRYAVVVAMDSTDAWHMMFEHRDPDESERLAMAIERVRDERANPRPLSPALVGMIAGQMERWPGEYLSRIERALEQLDADDCTQWSAIIELARRQCGEAVQLLETDYTTDDRPTSDDLDQARGLLALPLRVANALEQLVKAGAEQSQARQELDQLAADA